MTYEFTIIRNTDYFGAEGDDFESAIDLTKMKIEEILQQNNDELIVGLVGSNKITIKLSKGSSLKNLPFTLRECKELLKKGDAFNAGFDGCPYFDSHFLKVIATQY